MSLPGKWLKRNPAADLCPLLSHSLASKNIAIATDLSPWSEQAMQHALVIARWYGAALHILHTAVARNSSSCPI
jgi:nucleotide-binding universal stress UspA family protein